MSTNTRTDIIKLLTTLIIITPIFLVQNTFALPKKENKVSTHKDSPYRGWDYLVNKLKLDGINDDDIRRIFSDPRMPSFSRIPFKLSPKESKRLYMLFYDKSKIDTARTFIAEHEEYFSHAEQTEGVNRYVICAILLIETQLGERTGNDLVINRLARLASIADPTNVHENYLELKKQDPSVSLDAVTDRARLLESTFYPEIPAIIEIARKNRLDIFSLKGSVSGAFGIPQFMPTSALRFGVDGNKDGIISLFTIPDAILSAANFLSTHGWKEDSTLSAKRKAIQRYNNSIPYVDAVLEVAELLRSP